MRGVPAVDMYPGVHSGDLSTMVYTPEIAATGDHQNFSPWYTSHAKLTNGHERSDSLTKRGVGAVVRFAWI